MFIGSLKLKTTQMTNNSKLYWVYPHTTHNGNSGIHPQIKCNTVYSAQEVGSVHSS